MKPSWPSSLRTASMVPVKRSSVGGSRPTSPTISAPASRASGLPHAVVRIAPDGLQVVRQPAQLAPAARGDLADRHRHRPAHAEDLAVHVELDWLPGYEGSRPVRVVLLQPPFAGDAVHDLQLLGMP